MRVLVTGATGLIGQRLVARLLTGDDQVRALTRQPLRALPLRKLGVQVMGGDITQPSTLPHALKDIDIVYHVAAQVGFGLPSPSFQLTNVTGTEHLLQAAEKAGVARFVYVSSVAAYAHPTSVTREDAPVGRAGRRGSYGASKAQADLLVQQAIGTTAMEIAIVRPTFIYDTGNRPTDLATWVRRAQRLPVVPMPGGGDYPLDVVHADDVAQLLVLCGTLPQAVGQSYNACGDEGLTLRAAFATPIAPSTRGVHILPLPTLRAQAHPTFPATKAREELQFLPQHHWGETPGVTTTVTAPE